MQKEGCVITRVERVMTGVTSLLFYACHKGRYILVLFR